MTTANSEWLPAFQAIYKAVAPEVKRGGGGARDAADIELMELNRTAGVTRRDLYLPGVDEPVGTISGSYTKPKAPKTAQRLVVADRDAFNAWAAAEAGGLAAQWLADDDEAAEGFAGYVFTVAGEVPDGCEFVARIIEPGDPGGRWQTRLHVDEERILTALFGVPTLAEAMQARPQLEAPDGEVAGDGGGE